MNLLTYLLKLTSRLRYCYIVLDVKAKEEIYYICGGGGGEGESVCKHWSSVNTGEEGGGGGGGGGRAVKQRRAWKIRDIVFSSL